MLSLIQDKYSKGTFIRLAQRMEIHMSSLIKTVQSPSPPPKDMKQEYMKIEILQR